jgi:hypothetical protein
MSPIPACIADFACLRPAKRNFAQAGTAKCGIKLKTRKFHNIQQS